MRLWCWRVKNYQLFNKSTHFVCKVALSSEMVDGDIDKIQDGGRSSIILLIMKFYWVWHFAFAKCEQCKYSPWRPCEDEVYQPSASHTHFFGSIIVLPFLLFAPGQTTLWRENGDKNKLSRNGQQASWRNKSKLFSSAFAPWFLCNQITKRFPSKCKNLSHKTQSNNIQRNK